LPFLPCAWSIKCLHDLWLGLEGGGKTKGGFLVRYWWFGLGTGRFAPVVGVVDKRLEFVEFGDYGARGHDALKVVL
jgi:hypothetical protein